MATSAVPGALAALVSLLQADATLVAAGCQITYGPPLPRPEDEYIAILGTVGADETQAAAALGRQRREEIFTIRAHISVVRGGMDFQNAVERAYELAAAVEAMLRTSNATLSNTVRVAEIVGLPVQLFARDDGTGVEARIEMRIRCSQRI